MRQALFTRPDHFWKCYFAWANRAGESGIAWGFCKISFVLGSKPGFVSPLSLLSIRSVMQFQAFRWLQVIILQFRTRQRQRSSGIPAQQNWKFPKEPVYSVHSIRYLRLKSIDAHISGKIIIVWSGARAHTCSGSNCIGRASAKRLRLPRKNYALQISILSDNIISSSSLSFGRRGALRWQPPVDGRTNERKIHNIIGNNIELFCNLPKQQRQRIRWIPGDKRTT